MDITVTCPGCNKQYSVAAEHVGKKVGCQQCSMQFTVQPQTSATPQPPTPISKKPKPINKSLAPAAGAPAVEEFAAEEPRTSADFSRFKKRSAIDKYRANNEGLRPATSWLDIFDWKFEKYLTPWVLRLVWICCLVGAGFWLLLLTLSTIGSFFPPETSDGFRRASSSSVAAMLGAIPLVRSLSPETLVNIVKFIGFVFLFTSATLCLLWIRVILESFIVVFNIATTLKSIDDKTEAHSE